ncbi:hypothetical protein HDV57DRAFT_335363 [Trichoderma longibrachiatum]
MRRSTTWRHRLQTPNFHSGKRGRAAFALGWPLLRSPSSGTSAQRRGHLLASRGRSRISAASGTCTRMPVPLQLKAAASPGLKVFLPPSSRHSSSFLLLHSLSPLRCARVCHCFFFPALRSNFYPSLFLVAPSLCNNSFASIALEIAIESWPQVVPLDRVACPLERGGPF